MIYYDMTVSLTESKVGPRNFKDSDTVADWRQLK